MEKHGFPFGLGTSTTDDGHYYMVYTMKNYADVDSWHKAWEEFAAKAGWSASSPARPDGRLRDRGRLQVLDLPNRPVLPALRRASEARGDRLLHLGFRISHPRKEAEFEAINKEWIALSGRKGARDPFDSSAAASGRRSPPIAGSSGGRAPPTMPRPRRRSGRRWGRRARRCRRRPGPL